MKGIIKKINSYWRFYFVILFSFLIITAFFFRLYQLQVLEQANFIARATSQIKANSALWNDWQVLRGKIYFQDKNNNLIPVAINKNFWQIYAVPKEIENPEKTAQILSEVLYLNREELIEKFSKADDLFEIVLKKTDQEIVEKIKILNLKGIYFKEIIGRYYPYKELASQVIGYVKDDELDFKGQYGLEKYYDNYLSNQVSLVDILSLKNLVANHQIYDLITTIDYSIQRKAEELLKNGVENCSAESGSIIVMEPSTGRILAMANYPNFDPNIYYRYPLSYFPNPAVEFIYEPGSVFKLITVAAGLETKKITPQTKYYDTGEVVVNDKVIKNWDLKAHGEQNILGILAHSLNTGAVFIEKLTGHDLFHQMVLNFGFDQKTGIDLPGEVKSNLNNLKGFQDIHFATASFGQGIAVTPIALLDAVSAIVNKGVLMKPYVVEKIVNPENGEEISIKPTIRKRVLSEENARLLKIMMVESVEINKLARLPGYQLGGKTGTAQIPGKNGEYTEETIHSFVGFGPAEDPRFVILVKIDKPQGARFASTTAIPIFKELAKFILNYYEIPPSL